ncbi:MAG: TRL domain-containing protein [Kiritimatiellae bacterium]|nr:TRL domain-containing protein [Kiritimatiellia bacterium]
MKKRFLISVLLMVIIVNSGCVYSNVRVPMSKNFQNTQRVDKTGQATSRSVAWLVAWGDAGLQAAAEEGDLQTLEYVDYQFVNVIFGLYMSQTTIVYGN